jgi:hypothetical protein
MCAFGFTFSILIFFIKVVVFFVTSVLFHICTAFFLKKSAGQSVTTPHMPKLFPDAAMYFCHNFLCDCLITMNVLADTKTLSVSCMHRQPNFECLQICNNGSYSATNYCCSLNIYCLFNYNILCLKSVCIITY